MVFGQLDIHMQKTNNNNCWQECGETEPSYTAGGNVNGADTLGNSLVVPQKVKRLSFDLAIPLLGVYPREMKTCLHKNLHMLVHSNITYNS